MAQLLVGIAFIIVIFYRYKAYQKSRHLNRIRFIYTYVFPDSLAQRVLEKYPHLTPEQVNTVMEGLKEYFQICHIAGKIPVAMPSVAVDVAWHEFILFTKQYQGFCKQAIGHFLHHVPAEAMTTRTKAQEGIKNAWKISCVREGMSPNQAKKLPCLFALDTELNIPNGFKYSLDCKKGVIDSYCVAHIGCSSACDSGCSSDSDSSFSDCSSGCSSGCGSSD